eukprot:2759427-Pyramimonas_sp.AAC.1
METAWWTRLLGSSRELVERSLFQRGNPDHAMFSTDASTGVGMGGFLAGDYFSLSWSELGNMYDSPPAMFPVLSETTRRGHINYLELFAVYWALAKWGSTLSGRVLVLHVDNTVVLGCLASMSTSSLVLLPLLRAVAGLLLRHDIRLTVTYIASAVNAMADALSR